MGKIQIPEKILVELKRAKDAIVQAHGERVYADILAGEYTPPEIHELLQRAGCR